MDELDTGHKTDEPGALEAGERPDGPAAMDSRSESSEDCEPLEF